MKKIFGLIIFIVGISQGEQRADKELFKTLEYAANHKGNTNDILDDLNIVDLNLIEEDEFAYDVLEGVDRGLDSKIISDQQIDQPGLVTGDNADPTPLHKTEGILLMHRGSYEPSPERNSYIDNLIVNVKNEIRKRDLDPIYFTVHNRGVVRHAPKGLQTRDGQLVGEDGSPAPALEGKRKRTGILGAGHIEGLLKLKRFGNAEARKEEDKWLVKSHYFFGRLNVDLVFRVTNGLREINSTLRTLAAHALFEVDDSRNTTKLLEFIIDSPLEYEIDLRGTRNKRLRILSQAAILRLFKRDGRMQTRLQRCFDRATKKPLKRRKSAPTGEKRVDTNRARSKPAKLISGRVPSL